MGHVVTGHQCPRCGSTDLPCLDKAKMTIGCGKCDWVGPFSELNEQWLIIPEKCDVCHEMKEDVRASDLLNKRVCSDCMGVEKFSEEEKEIREVS